MRSKSARILRTTGAELRGTSKEDRSTSDHPISVTSQRLTATNKVRWRRVSAAHVKPENHLSKQDPEVPPVACGVRPGTTLLELVIHQLTCRDFCRTRRDHLQPRGTSWTRDNELAIGSSTGLRAD